MVITPCTVILLILSVAPQLSLQQGQVNLTIKPQLAVRGAPVVFECTLSLSTDMALTRSYAALIVRNLYSSNVVVHYYQTCSPLTKTPVELLRKKEFLRARVTSDSCYSMTVSNVIASEQTAADYYCSFRLGYRTRSRTAETVIQSWSTALTVGDETPEVSALEVRQASDAKLIVVDNGEVNAGTNVSITCSANTVKPVPEYNITAGGQNLTTKIPAAVDNGRVSINYLVPNQTSVKIACSLNNGFGTQKSKEMLIIIVDDPLQLKIFVKDTYGMMHKVQNDSHAVTDIVYAPMGQFGMWDDGYKDPGVYIFCNMTGNPYGTELELVHNDPTPTSDVPDVIIKQCNKMRVMANTVFCPLRKYEPYADFKWQCRAKQTNPETGAAVTYVKKLDFVKVPSKIKIRFQYYNKWYGYDERDLRFYMPRGGVALIRCDAGYYEGGRLSEIPFPHRYEFYIVGQDGLPHYASPTGNTLTLTNIPETLDNKEIVCFIRPQNNSDIATQGIGQRYFKVSVFTMPEKPNIIVTMKDSVDPSLIIRNPETVELHRNGSAVELTCTLQSYDATVDKTSGENRYLDWVKCKNYKCLYAERIVGTTTEVSAMEKRLGGNKATLMVQTSYLMNSGIFMCVAVRPYINVTGDRDYQIQSVPIKALVLTPPGKGDGQRFFGMIDIDKTASGDLKFACKFVGYPYPDLEITRHDMDNRDVRLENPKWIRQIEEAYYGDMQSYIYGSQLIYKLPAENIGADKAMGTYVCTATNSLGTAQVKRTWDGTITL